MGGGSNSSVAITAGTTVGNTLTLTSPNGITITGNTLITGNLNVTGTISKSGVSIFPVTIANGGTGQTTKTPAFNALSPLTTAGDLITYSGGNNIRLAVSPNYGTPLISQGAATAPLWSGGTIQQVKASQFTITGVPSVLDTPFAGSVTPAISVPNASVVLYVTVSCTDFSSSDNSFTPSADLDISTDGGTTWATLVTNAIIGRQFGVASAVGGCFQGYIKSDVLPPLSTNVQLRLSLNAAFGTHPSGTFGMDHGFINVFSMCGTGIE